MNDRADLERALADAYAADVPRRAPDWVLRGALTTIDNTRQRQALGRAPWRFDTMNSFARLAIAAVAVIVVSTAGLAAFANRDAASSPSPRATTDPATSPSTAPSVAWQFRTPFRYVLPSGVEFAYGTRHHNYFEIRVPAANDAGHPAGLIIQAIRAGRVDPCDASSPASPIEGGPKGVFDYLRTIPGITMSNEAAKIVGGIQGRQASVTAVAGSPGCPELWPWFEDTEAFITGLELRLVAFDASSDQIVVTSFGERENDWWPALSDELIGSLDFTQLTLPVPAIEMRVEPSGPPALVVASPGLVSEFRHQDGVDDTGVDLVDLSEISFGSPCYGAAICVYFTLSGTSDRPLNDPATDWVAYGLMVDNDGDGVADVQAGIDNGNFGPRSWRTDLETGVTETESRMYLSDLSVDGHVGFIRDAESGPLHGWIGVDQWLAKPELRFYLWASILREGTVVATDFAPDVGWLDGYQH